MIIDTEPGFTSILQMSISLLPSLYQLIFLKYTHSVFIKELGIFQSIYEFAELWYACLTGSRAQPCSEWLKVLASSVTPRSVSPV